MLSRRALALTTIFCLLIGLMAVPQGPILVCRITGTLMPPVAVPDARPGDTDTCCMVTVSKGVTPHFALSAPGCCELRQDQARAADPAVTTDNTQTSAVALLPAVSCIPVPDYAAVTVGTVTPRESPPRAPPLSSASPRAPPVFS